jgi:hypothetical protein
MVALFIFGRPKMGQKTFNLDAVSPHRGPLAEKKARNRAIYMKFNVGLADRRISTLVVCRLQVDPVLDIAPSQLSIG